MLQSRFKNSEELSTFEIKKRNYFSGNNFSKGLWINNKRRVLKSNVGPSVRVMKIAGWKATNENAA